MSLTKQIRLNCDLSKTLEADYSDSNSCLFHQVYEQVDAYDKYGQMPDTYCAENTSINQVWWDLEDFDIDEMEKQLNMDIKTISTIRQDPGNFIHMHKDVFKKIKNDYDVTGKQIVRSNIHLNDWQPGQSIQYEKDNKWYNYVNWEVGDGILMDDECLHIGINAGLQPKYTMQISGFYNG